MARMKLLTSMEPTHVQAILIVTVKEPVPALIGVKVSVDVNQRRFQQSRMEKVIVPTMKSSTNWARTDVRLRKTAQGRDHAQLTDGAWDKVDALCPRKEV